MKSAGLKFWLLKEQKNSNVESAPNLKHIATLLVLVQILSINVIIATRGKTYITNSGKALLYSGGV